ncbi:MAG: hypothetical protein KKF56_01625 [Nanoarchaeota archaeon]|nr:hypothetical protein [Nanoarchaeota archaeon]
MEYCFKCGKSENDVKILDAVSNNEMVSICDECAEFEEIPIIRKPSTYQLKEINNPRNVKERLLRMAGLDKKEPTIDDLRTDFKVSEEDVVMKSMPLNLIENFHWHIQNARKKSKLDIIQMSKILGENEFILRELEKGNLPDDAFMLLKKIEQYFQIKLMKREEVRKPVNRFDWSRKEEIKEEWRREEEEKVEKEIKEVHNSLKDIDSSKSEDKFPYNQQEDFFEVHEKLSEKSFDEVSTSDFDVDDYVEEKVDDEKKEDELKKIKFDEGSLKSLTISDLQRMKEEKEMRESMGDDVDFVEDKEVPDHLKDYERIGDEMKKRAVEGAGKESVKKEFHY